MRGLSACIIVKNEHKRLDKLLAPLIRLADQIVIVDTGSTDGTRKYAEHFLDGHGVLSKLKFIEKGDAFVEPDGVFHFGNAKQFAIDSADCDYVMWLDANDEVTEPEAVRKEVLEAVRKTPDSYFVMNTVTNRQFGFNRIRIAPRGKCAIEGRIHETMMVSEGLTRVFITHPILNIKTKRNIERNLSALLKNWDERGDARTAFYLGLTYRDMGDTPKALEWFMRRGFGIPGEEEYNEECFKAYEMVAECCKPGDETHMLIAKTMIAAAPYRMEGWYAKGRCLAARLQWKAAVECFAKWEECITPKYCKLWLNEWIYNPDKLRRVMEECYEHIRLDVQPLVPDQIMDYASGMEMMVRTTGGIF